MLFGLSSHIRLKNEGSLFRYAEECGRVMHALGSHIFPRLHSRRLQIIPPEKWGGNTSISEALKLPPGSVDVIYAVRLRFKEMSNAESTPSHCLHT